MRARACWPWPHAAQPANLTKPGFEQPFLFQRIEINDPQPARVALHGGDEPVDD
jgi:hypothetical protein